jgi:hypothetical protein
MILQLAYSKSYTQAVLNRDPRVLDTHELLLSGCLVFISCTS